MFVCIACMYLYFKKDLSGTTCPPLQSSKTFKKPNILLNSIDSTLSLSLYKNFLFECVCVFAAKCQLGTISPDYCFSLLVFLKLGFVRTCTQ